MKCGDRGFTNATGQPCGQVIGAKSAGCIFHDPARAGEAKKAQAKGALASRMRFTLPKTYQVPEFATRESIVRWAEDMAGRVLRGELDPKLSAEARGHAQLALQARTAEAQKKLVEALLRVEHGGAAMLLLTKLQDGLADGRRRPLPGRVVSLPTPPDGDAS